MKPHEPRVAGADLYFDANASTPVHPRAFEAAAAFLSDSYGNPGAGHPSGRAGRAAIDAARAVVARAIGAEPGEIFFTSGGTESNNWAVQGMAPADRPGHLVASAIEHKSVLAPLAALESRGHRVTIVDPGPDGAVRVRDVEAALRPDTVLVSVMGANNETGVVQPAREIGAACRARGVRFHSDAVCTFGKIRVDVRELGCDLLSIGAHKVYAPKGVGVLYVRRGTPLAPLIHGCGQQDGMRAGTENPFGVVAFARAVELHEQGELSPSEPYEVLRDELWRGLAARVPGCRRNGAGALLPNTLNVVIPGVPGHELQRVLGEQGMAVSAPGAASAVSHVLVAMGVSEADARCSVRLSLSRHATRASVARLVDAVAEVAARAGRADGVAAARAASGGAR